MEKRIVEENTNKKIEVNYTYTDILVPVNMFSELFEIVPLNSGEYRFDIEENDESIVINRTDDTDKKISVKYNIGEFNYPFRLDVSLMIYRIMYYRLGEYAFDVVNYRDNRSLSMFDKQSNYEQKEAILNKGGLVKR